MDLVCKGTVLYRMPQIANCCEDCYCKCIESPSLTVVLCIMIQTERYCAEWYILCGMVVVALLLYIIELRQLRGKSREKGVLTLSGMVLRGWTPL